MFYTRIPVPAWVGFSTEQGNRSTKYLPALGWIVGSVVAGVYAVAQLVFPTAVAVVLGLIAGVLCTGAFHEDGFADICDGLGGGLGKERSLEIMKDSRLGAYAVLGTVLLFALKITTLTAIGDAGLATIAAAIVFAAVFSRWFVVTIIFTDEYARDDQTSKVKSMTARLSRPELIAATGWILPLLGLAWWRPWWLLAVPLALAGRFLLARWFRRRLGGYTGDCLGATQQILEMTILLTVLASVAV